jgi:putative toxin-antitoxin system antitoxin component (TIGR02293 family)
LSFFGESPILNGCFAKEIGMAATARVGEVMGGRPALGVVPSTPDDLVELVRGGVPIAAIDHMLQSQVVRPGDLETLVIPRRTLANRRRLGRLSPEQSDRLLRVARLIAEAIETFGSKEKAVAWLRRPTTLLGGHPPIERLDTDTGCREVETALGRIAHGIAA